MNNFPTKHHCIGKSVGGSNDKENIYRIPRLLHDYVHLLLKLNLPHQALLLVLDITGKPLREDIKDKIRDLLITDNPEELYKKGVIKDRRKFKKQNDKFIKYRI